MSLASRLIKAIFATEAGVLTAASSPAASDNSKKIATTEWAAFGFAILKGGNGYIKLPTWLGGLIVQWGTTANIAGGSHIDVTLPIPMPTAVLQVIVSAQAFGDSTTPIVGGWQLLDLARITVRNTSGGTAQFSWFAIGY